MIGKTISHYRILEKLGEGGMGVVYKAEDSKLKRNVALKFLPSELTRSDEWQQRFLREAQAAAALAHPNICTIYEIDETEGQAFIAMECIEGRSLTDRIESGPLALDEAINIALQVAEGLRHAHKRGIIHRDIKPANIMITEDRHAKIMDFGLAKLAGKTRLTRTATVMGTVDYMSPEQARGDPVDHRTDIWSMGIMLYEILTGQTPFKGHSEQAVIYSILNEEPEQLSNVRSQMPASLDRIAINMLKKNPRDRYEDMESLIAEMQSVKSQTSLTSVSIETSSPSIAVLPFVNMSADPDQEYFCDGLAEEIINALTQFRDLRVIARTSAFSFKEKDADIYEIGRKLKVGTVLEGSVRKAGNRLRITAQLVDTSGGHHLWSERYDREMGDIFAIQDEITLAIVDKLGPTLVGKQRAKPAGRQTLDLEAYNLYLKGRWFWNKQSEEGLQKAIEYFEKAIERCPDYALAYAGLADCYSALPYYAPYPPKEAFARSQEFALKALHLDADLAEVHVSLGRIRKNYGWDWENAEKELRRAIELNPGCASAHHWFSNLLVCMTRFDEAIEEVTHALRLDPLSLAINAFSGFVYFFARKYDLAIEASKRTLEMDPGSAGAHCILGLVYMEQSLYEKALSELTRARELSRGLDVFVESRIGCIHALMGENEKAQQVLEDLLDRSRDVYVSPYLLADIEFRLGENDRAFEFLEKAYEARDNFLQYLKADHKFDTLNLRSDPRYIALLKKINLEP